MQRTIIQHQSPHHSYTAPAAISWELHKIIEKMIDEYLLNDHLEGEALRVLLKYFIIICTRLAKRKLDITTDQKTNGNIIRQFYILVNHLFY